MAGLLPLGFLTFLDTNGDPLAGGSVGYYEQNSPGTLKAIWGNSGQTTQLQNPVPLDAAGRPFSGGSEVGIYGVGQYEMIVNNANGALQWTALTAEPLSTTGGTVNGNFTVNGLLSAITAYISGNLTVAGTSTLQNVIINSGRAQLDALLVTGAATFNGTLYSGGAVVFNNNLQVNQNILAEGQIQADAGFFVIPEFGFYVQPGNSDLEIFNYRSQHFWSFVVSNGSLSWIAGGNVGNLWTMRESDRQCGNPAGIVFGNGAYSDISDIRTKRDIHPTSIGLNEVLGLEPIDFVRLASGKSDVGFSAQQVRDILPIAITQLGDMGLGVATTPIIAALVNAVKTLTTRVIQLESQAKP